MSNLILAQSETLTMSSREIAELTGKSVGHIHRDFKVMVLELGLSFPFNPFLDLGDTSDLDDVVSITKASELVGVARKTIYAHFKSGKLKPSKGGVCKSELVRVYGKSNSGDFEGIEGCTFSFDSKKRISSINLNQELTMTLVSGYNVKLRNAIIKRWQELEQLQAPVSQPKIPGNFAEALQLAADQAKQLELAAPKVAFVDSFVESAGNKTFRQVAKMLSAKERLFRAFLVSEGFMYKIGGEWTAYQNHIAAGRFCCKVGEKNGHAFTECKFTPKGIEHIAGKWILAGNA